MRRSPGLFQPKLSLDQQMPIFRWSRDGVPASPSPSIQKKPSVVEVKVLLPNAKKTDSEVGAGGDNQGAANGKRTGEQIRSNEQPRNVHTGMGSTPTGSKRAKIEEQESSTGKPMTPPPIVTAQSIPPGDIKTQPSSKIVFNAPFDFRPYHIRIANTSSRRIVFEVKVTNTTRVRVMPPFGVLDPHEAMFLNISFDAYSYVPENATNDRIIIEWINTPDGSNKQYCHEWFLSDGMFRRKSISVEYNQ